MCQFDIYVESQEVTSPLAFPVGNFYPHLTRHRHYRPQVRNVPLGEPKVGCEAHAFLQASEHRVLATKGVTAEEQVKSIGRRRDGTEGQKAVDV